MPIQRTKLRALIQESKPSLASLAKRAAELGQHSDAALKSAKALLSDAQAMGIDLTGDKSQNFWFLDTLDHMVDSLESVSKKAAASEREFKKRG